MTNLVVKSMIALALGSIPGILAAQEADPIKKPPEAETQAPAAGTQGSAGSGTPSGEGETTGGTQGAQDQAPTEGQTEPSSGESGQQAPDQPDAGQDSTGSEAGQGAPDTDQAPAGAQEGTTPEPDSDMTTGQQPESEAPSTTDQEGASTSSGADITVEQRTEIKQIITETEVEPVPDTDISVDIGVAVPETIELHPLPPRIIELVPDYEGYLYFVLADGRVIIVDPDSNEVVLILT